MTTVSPQDAQARFLELLSLVERGEEVVIERDGRCIARISAVEPDDRPPPQRRFGWGREMFGTPEFSFEPESDEEDIESWLNNPHDPLNL